MLTSIILSNVNKTLKGYFLFYGGVRNANKQFKFYLKTINTTTKH